MIGDGQPGTIWDDLDRRDLGILRIPIEMRPEGPQPPPWPYAL